MRRGGDCSWRMRRRCDVADAAATAGGNFMNFRQGVPCLKHFMCRPQVPTSAHDFPRFYTRCVQVVRSVAALVGLQLLGMNRARDCAGKSAACFNSCSINGLPAPPDQCNISPANRVSHQQQLSNPRTASKHRRRVTAEAHGCIRAGPAVYPPSLMSCAVTSACFISAALMRMLRYATDVQ